MYHHTDGYVVAKEMGNFESVCNEPDGKKLPLPKHPLWQKMKSLGNTLALMYFSTCFPILKATSLYSVLEALIAFKKPVSQVRSLLLLKNRLQIESFV